MGDNSLFRSRDAKARSKDATRFRPSADLDASQARDTAPTEQRPLNDSKAHLYPVGSSSRGFKIGQLKQVLQPSHRPKLMRSTINIASETRGTPAASASQPSKGNESTLFSRRRQDGPGHGHAHIQSTDSRNRMGAPMEVSGHAARAAPLGGRQLTVNANTLMVDDAFRVLNSSQAIKVMANQFIRQSETEKRAQTRQSKPKSTLAGPRAHNIVATTPQA